MAKRKVPLRVPRALRSQTADTLRERIGKEKKGTDFDRRFATRIFRSLGPEWQVLDPPARERVIRAITAVVAEEMNPELKAIIIDPNVDAIVYERTGSPAGIPHLIGVEDAEFHPAVHRLTDAAYLIESDEQVEPLVRRRIQNCLIALRSVQKTLVTRYRAEGAPLE